MMIQRINYAENGKKNNFEIEKQGLLVEIQIS